jgi:hypothetical protein
MAVIMATIPSDRSPGCWARVKEALKEQGYNVDRYFINHRNMMVFDTDPESALAFKLTYGSNSTVNADDILDK